MGGMNRGADVLRKFNQLPTRCQELIFGHLCMSWGNDWVSDFLAQDFTFPLSESPIETIMAVSFDLFKRISKKGFKVIQQKEIVLQSGKKYRVDFYVTCKNESVIVECDGHDFHEKTKEQVAKDNERDLGLKMEGYEVLHFSGSQIYKDPFIITLNVIDYLEERSKKHE